MNREVDPDVRDGKGNTLSSWRARTGCGASPLVLREGADINAVNRQGNTALHFCPYGFGDTLGSFWCRAARTTPSRTRRPDVPRGGPLRRLRQPHDEPGVGLRPVAAGGSGSNDDAGEGYYGYDAGGGVGDFMTSSLGGALGAGGGEHGGDYNHPEGWPPPRATTRWATTCRRTTTPTRSTTGSDQLSRLPGGWGWGAAAA